MDPGEAQWWSYVRGTPDSKLERRVLPMVSVEHGKLPSVGASMSLARHIAWPDVMFAATVTGEIYSLSVNNGKARIPPANLAMDTRADTLRRFPNIAAHFYARNYTSAYHAVSEAFAMAQATSDDVRKLVACLPREDGILSDMPNWKPGESQMDPLQDFRKEMAAANLGLSPLNSQFTFTIPEVLKAITLRADLEERAAQGKWELVAKRARDIVASVEAEFASTWEVEVWTGSVLYALIAPVIAHDLLRGTSLAARLAQIIHASSLVSARPRFATLAPLLHLTLFPTVFDVVPAISMDEGPMVPTAHWDCKVDAVRWKLEDDAGKEGLGVTTEELAIVLHTGELVMPMLKIEMWGFER